MKKLLFAFCMLLVVNLVKAQPFTLDRSFGNNGYVSTTFGFSLNVQGSFNRHIVSRPDGSFYLPVQKGRDIFIVRHLVGGA